MVILHLVISTSTSILLFMHMLSLQFNIQVYFSRTSCSLAIVNQMALSSLEMVSYPWMIVVLANDNSGVICI